jgi:hypothetical protein
MIGCTASPTLTMLAASVARDRSPPKRPNKAACRYNGNRRTCRRQGFGLVEEHVLLLGAAYFRLGVEQLAQMFAATRVVSYPMGCKRSLDDV